jgi:hypothetical protein
MPILICFIIRVLAVGTGYFSVITESGWHADTP